jgi:molybdenum cofactor cytidylyltransferase
VKFGPVAIEAAQGGIVAHTVRAGSLILKKGETVAQGHLAALRAHDIAEITLARLEPGDVTEDAAAEALAARVAGPHLRVEAPFTGRSNLFASAAGVLVVDSFRLDEVNGVDEAVTVATLPPFRSVEDGEMIATVKIIPFAVSRDVLERAKAAAKRPLVEIKPFLPLSVGVVSTLLAGLKPSVVDKTLRALERRLAPTGARILRDLRVRHDVAELAAAIKDASRDCDLMIVFGASAITDRRDVIPKAVEAAGGTNERLGMPVDPGNLLLLARTANGRPLIGTPGCARSPKENGFDWVLHRLLAGIDVTSRDIRAMGAGGLLMEIVSRPQPRGDAEADVETHVERLEADE